MHHPASKAIEERVFALSRHVGTHGIRSIQARDANNPYILVRFSGALELAVRREITEEAHPYRVRFADDPARPPLREVRK